MNSVRTVKSGDLVIRFRKEAFGCLIYDSRNVYAEGNRTIYDFLVGLSEGKDPEAISREIAALHGVPEKTVYEDLFKFLKVAALLGWFRDVHDSLKKLA